MKKSFFKLLIFIIAFLITQCTPVFNYCSAQWIQQNSGTNFHLWDIYFTSAQTGWIAADSSYHGKLLKINPATKIKFEIPSNDKSETQDGYFPLRRGVGGMTTLIIFDILGHEIVTLVNEKLNPGTYEIEWNASQYPSGVYFYQLRAGELV